MPGFTVVKRRKDRVERQAKLVQGLVEIQAAVQCYVMDIGPISTDAREAMTHVLEEARHTLEVLQDRLARTGWLECRKRYYVPHRDPETGLHYEIVYTTETDGQGRWFWIVKTYEIVEGVIGKHRSMIDHEVHEVKRRKDAKAACEVRWAEHEALYQRAGR